VQEDYLVCSSGGGCESSSFSVVHCLKGVVYIAAARYAGALLLLIARKALRKSLVAHCSGCCYYSFMHAANGCVRVS
jgi:hypothetical protein